MTSPSYDELLQQLHEARKEADYYRKTAEKAGAVRLRETEQLSLLIRARRKAEQRMEKARDELEKRVEARTEQLSKANAELKKEIAERKQSARRLAESEKKYRALFESSLDALSLTRDGIILDVNPAWLRLHGYGEKKEVVGRNVVDLVYPRDKEILEKRRRNWPWLGHERYPIRDVRKDGTVVEVEIYSNTIALEDRDAILTTVRDVSERRKVEAERRRLEEKLRHSEKMEAIGTLAGGVAHDLNNILSGVVSYPELLLMDLPEDSPLRGALTTIYHSGLKASAIVQDLLTLARRGVTVKKPLQLNRVVSDYLASAEFAKLKEFHPKVEVGSRLDPNLPPIVGSPVHLSKTVMNLVSNAAEAMPEGGKITLETEHRRIEKPAPAGRKPGRFVLFRISDTGIGISADDVRRIFEPFYTKKVMGRSGTGLGMAVVWGTVEDHGGEIEVDSREGEGTTFTLLFPAGKEAVVETAAPCDLERHFGGGETVLVVDDVADQRKIASRMLERLGYRAHSVSSGDAAIDYLQSRRADVVLLDMIMEHGPDGLETYRELLKIRPGQKAVIASGFSKTERVREAQRLGAAAYLRKPYSIESLAKAIRSALETPPPAPQTPPDPE